MTIPFWSLVGLIIITYLTKVPVMLGMIRAGGYDNHHPRDQQALLTGWAKRAVAAHQNSFEFLTVFSPCVFINHLASGEAGASAVLALLVAVFRLLYVGLYIADYSKLRSLVWFAGILGSAAMALLGAF